MRNLSLLGAASALVLLSGCASLSNGSAPPSTGQIAAVQTDYSLGLACLGDRIDRSGRPPLKVFVDPINDLTVPRNFEERRLSSGGKWWLLTALQKIDARKIEVVTHDGSKADPKNPSHLVLSGAWTQDDLKLGRQEAGLKAWVPKVILDLGASRTYDVIAGDFASSRNGRVAHAAAVSVVVQSSSVDMNLKVEDGDRKLSLGFSQRLNEGPQFAQRRIAEAAVMVHMARAFGVDYRPCIESQANPGAAKPAGLKRQVTG
ncbi:MAG: hypothetical protein MUF76_13250 [Hydrogenophaga sp.]|jgi:hypothetical protein|nr:hypothetical protein [Hydrogenophaga sp.]